MQEWPAWRLWLKKNISINEIFYEWTFDEVMKANAILDMDETYKDAFEEFYRPKSMKGK